MITKYIHLPEIFRKNCRAVVFKNLLLIVTLTLFTANSTGESLNNPIKNELLETDLLRKYAPIFFFHPEEKIYPWGINSLLNHSDLKKLKEYEILTRSDMLIKLSTEDEVNTLSKNKDIDKLRIKWWVYLCDLLRIPSMTIDNAVLLESIGQVNTVQALQRDTVDAIHDRLRHYRIPKESIQIWKDNAARLKIILHFE